MEVIVITTGPLASVNVRIGDKRGTLDATLVSKTPGRYEYVVFVASESAEPTKKITVAIFASEATNITSFTIKACTGNVLLLMH